MSRWSRVLLALAAVSLVSTLLLPLWRIELEAPQYPEGLGMSIWADKITGDLRSINGLNHYIGMKEIHPEAIPELRLMPIVVKVLGALGLVAAIVGRRWGLVGWTALVSLAAVVGLADFWIWGYDYGHDLDPTAAIKVPGLNYQPPLIGAKQLLNFRAISMPAAGGWVATAAITLAVILSTIAVKRARRFQS
jgi:copper chaperone NosL